MIKLCPVMYPVFANIVTTFATSWGSPIRPSGMLAAPPGMTSAVGTIPVSPIKAGATSLTEMLYGASFDERLRIIDDRPPFDAA